MSDSVNENSTSYVTAVPKDADGVAALPASMVYQIDCVTTGTAIKAETALTPGTSVEIEIDAADNAIISQTNAVERRQVTVTAGYGINDQVIEVYEYRVINLNAVT